MEEGATRYNVGPYVEAVFELNVREVSLNLVGAPEVNSAEMAPP